MVIRTKISSLFFLACFLMIFAVPSIALSYDLNEKFAVEGTLTGVYQYGDFDVEGVDNADKGAVALDLGVNFHPTESDEFQVTLSFAAGNGLNSANPFSLTPYADDLEDDLKDINGRTRDYLLEAWYKHTFAFSEATSLAVTGGIIDSTVFLDDNAFANDEKTQFMNQIFVNHKNVNIPSYDLGAALELNVSSFSIRGVAIIRNLKTEKIRSKTITIMLFRLAMRLKPPWAKEITGSLGLPRARVLRTGMQQAKRTCREPAFLRTSS